MPYRLVPLSNGKYKVVSPTNVHAKGTTLYNAKRQLRLLNAIEFGEWKPTKK